MVEYTGETPVPPVVHCEHRRGACAVGCTLGRMKKPGVQLEGQTPSLVGVGRETVRGTASDKIEIIFDLLCADWVIRQA